METISRLVSEGFIWSVGITRPRPGQEKRAALYITSVLLLSILLACGTFSFLLNRVF